MNYEVGGKWVFATKEEAIDFANWYARETKYILCVNETNRKISHIFNGGN